LVLTGFLFACGRDEPSGPPQSTAVPGLEAAPPPAPLKIVVPEKPGTLEDLVPMAELVARYPSVAALSEPHRQIAVGAMHLVPGPCGPCADQSQHLARCALQQASPKCANIPGLVRRATTDAGEGKPFKAVLEAIHYPDVWTALPPGASGRVPIDLVIGGADPWDAEAQSARSALEGRYGDKIQVRVHSPESDLAKALGVRATPTWAVAGYRMRGAQSAPALGRLIDRELGRAQ